jgi:hypothetical protein
MNGSRGPNAHPGVDSEVGQCGHYRMMANQRGPKLGKTKSKETMASEAREDKIKRDVGENHPTTLRS